MYCALPSGVSYSHYLLSSLLLKAVEVQPKNQSMAAMLENHVANATWKAFVVECKEDYDLLYREVREKRGISINIVIVDKLESRPRMYSPERMAVLKNE